MAKKNMEPTYIKRISISNDKISKILQYVTQNICQANIHASIAVAYHSLWKAIGIPGNNNALNAKPWIQYKTSNKA